MVVTLLGRTIIVVHGVESFQHCPEGRGKITGKPVIPIQQQVRWLLLHVGFTK